MATDIGTLLKQRKALDEELTAAIQAAREGGEVITIDGHELNSVIDFEGELPPVSLDNLIPTYTKDKNGDINPDDAREISFQEIIDAFGQEATDKINEAVTKGEEAVENIQTAETSALSAIGRTDSEGARKAALDSIESKRASAVQSVEEAETGALDEIGRNSSQGAWKGALDDIQAALTSALSSIGQDDSSGARGDAISAINTLKTQIEGIISDFNSKITSDNSAWDSKVSADLASLSQALSSALASIGQTDSEGARGAAIAAINALYSQIQEYVASANTTIDQKVSAASGSATAAATSASQASTKAGEASTSASEAAGSANLAEKWASNPENSVVENGEYSAKHYAAKAAASASAASGSASAAATSASQASTKAGEASTSAGEAASSASQAASSASAADSAKTAAEAARDEAQSIVGTALTPNRALVSDANGKFSASGVTATELGYLSGVTSGVQVQINDKLIKSAQIFLAGAVTGNGTFADGSMTIDLELGQALQEMLNEFNLYKLRGGLPVGVVVPWFNPDHTPERTLIANGAVISETHEAWPTLAAAWGISSGAITLPDMTNTINGDGKGNYICFTEDDSVVGTRVADAIRNIIGKITRSISNNNQVASGSLYFDGLSSAGFSGGSITWGNLAFDAQRGDLKDNPTSGHTDTYGHPHTIFALPLIAF